MYRCHYSAFLITQPLEPKVSELKPRISELQPKISKLKAEISELKPKSPESRLPALSLAATASAQVRTPTDVLF